MSTKSKIDIEFSRVSVIFDRLVVNILLYSEFVFRGNFCSGKSRCKSPKNGQCKPYLFPFPTFDGSHLEVFFYAMIMIEVKTLALCDGAIRLCYQNPSRFLFLM